MLSKGFKARLCAVVMVAGLSAAAHAGEESSLSLSSRDLAIAVAAKDEFVRHMGNQDFTMRVVGKTAQDHAFISYERFGAACDAGPSGICDGRCGRCFQVVIGPDLKVIRRQWRYSPALERAGEPGAIPRTLVTWLGEPDASEKPLFSLSSRFLSIATAAKEEFMRQEKNQDFDMRIQKTDVQYDVDVVPNEGGYRCDNPIPNACGNGCGGCFQITVGADLKVVRSFWDRTNESIIEPDAILGGMVLPF